MTSLWSTSSSWVRINTKCRPSIITRRSIVTKIMNLDRWKSFLIAWSKLLITLFCKGQQHSQTLVSEKDCLSVDVYSHSEFVLLTWAVPRGTLSVFHFNPSRTHFYRWHVSAYSVRAVTRMCGDPCIGMYSSCRCGMAVAYCICPCSRRKSHWHRGLLPQSQALSPVTVQVLEWPPVELS